MLELVIPNKNGADIMTGHFPGLRANCIVQNSWIVRDVDAAATRWNEVFGVGPFYIFRDFQADSLLYRGKPGELLFNVAIAQAGDIQIELIAQTSSAPSAYRDLVPEGQEGFHHIGIFAEDYDKELAEYDSQGFARANEGRVGDMRYAYIDTSPTLGFMVELLEENAAMRDLFSKVRAASKGWNGDRPLRPVEELMETASAG